MLKRYFRRQAPWGKCRFVSSLETFAGETPRRGIPLSSKRFATTSSTSTGNFAARTLLTKLCAIAPDALLEGRALKLVARVGPFVLGYSPWLPARAPNGSRLPCRAGVGARCPPPVWTFAQTTATALAVVLLRPPGRASGLMTHSQRSPLRRPARSIAEKMSRRCTRS